MNVREAIEILQAMPGHWELVVDGGRTTTNPDSHGRDYRITADIQSDNFPAHGGVAVVILKGKM